MSDTVFDDKSIKTIESPKGEEMQQAKLRLFIVNKDTDVSISEEGEKSRSGNS